MITSSLTRFDNDGIELVIDIETGEAFATIRGYARMAGVHASTVSRRVKSVLNDNKTLTASGEGKDSFEPVAYSDIKEAEIDTGYGKKPVALIPAKLVFAWLVDDNRNLSLKMGECGATVFCTNWWGTGLPHLRLVQSP